MIVLDTDFFSSFFKIGRLDLILDVTGEEKLVIPGTVYDELQRTNFFDEIATGVQGKLQGIKSSKQFQFQHFCCGIKGKERFP